jgi:hypothetical protein
MTYANRDCVTSTFTRPGVLAAGVLQMTECVRVLVEDDRRREASKSSLGAGISCGSQTINNLARVIVDIPSNHQSDWSKTRTVTM